MSPPASKPRETGPEWLGPAPSVTPFARCHLGLRPAAGRALGVTNTLAVPPQLPPRFTQVTERLLAGELIVLGELGVLCARDLVNKNKSRDVRRANAAKNR